MRGWTLAQTFVCSVVGTALLVALLFGYAFKLASTSLLRESARLRDAAAARVQAHVDQWMRQAESSVEGFQRAVQFGAINPDDADAVEHALFAQMLYQDNLTELTWTFARRPGFRDNGDPIIAKEGRGQVSLLRHQGNRIVTHRVVQNGDQFVDWVRDRGPDGGLLSAPLQAKGKADDPTEHATFLTPASVARPQEMWSDLSWAQQDMDRPEAQRRIVVTVQEAILDDRNVFRGVLKVGLLDTQLDEVTGFKVDPTATQDPHKIFICDNEGRLISRLSKADTCAEVGDDLRCQPHEVPPEVKAALALPVLKQVTADAPAANSRMTMNGEAWLTSFRYLPRTQDWIVGIVVPEQFYLEPLLQSQHRIMVASIVVLLLALMAGLFTLQAVHKGLQLINAQTGQMASFDFSPSNPPSTFRDVGQTLGAMEKAKTALRAMGRYVPMDLVRELYESGQEPALGGRMTELTVMFTDIKDFTTTAEHMSPNQLAESLGAYLEAMTTAIHGQGGTVDKYIGDAVMCMWNAPRKSEHHALQACQAALDCVQAVEKLYASPAWTLDAPWRTRFGIHTDTVMVGHFGCSERLSYTAIGDGVNVASRLEGMNKVYGTTILVSETVHAAAASAFAFRRIDRVAVKGRQQGILIYELLGPPGTPRTEAVERYEQALKAYFARDFQQALSLLDPHDAPSQRLITRCHALIETPPPVDWDGSFVATMK
ncbi:MAG: adenylate/guanylate cyclase domain-containing protein [Candidatus Xenobia bacterium]